MTTPSPDEMRELAAWCETASKSLESVSLKSSGRRAALAKDEARRMYRVARMLAAAEQMTNHIHDLSGQGDGWWKCNSCDYYRTTTNLDQQLAAADAEVERWREIAEQNGRECCDALRLKVAAEQIEAELRAEIERLNGALKTATAYYEAAFTHTTPSAGVMYGYLIAALSDSPSEGSARG